MAITFDDSRQQVGNAARPVGRRAAAPGTGERMSEERSPARPGFLRRYRLPLFLAVVAVCLYAGSIFFIVVVRGQIGT